MQNCRDEWEQDNGKERMDTTNAPSYEEMVRKKVQESRQGSLV